MNWTNEEVAAAQADYERKMKRVRDRNTHKTGSEFAVESDLVPNSREVKTGGDNASENSTNAPERPRAGRSVKNQGVDMGKSEIVPPGRSRGRGPNKTEMRFKREFLDLKYGPDQIDFESLRLKLARGVFYVPDWVVIGMRGHVYCYEVKGGFIRNPGRARTKYLIAKEQWPCFTFEAWQYKNGIWKEIWR